MAIERFDVLDTSLDMWGRLVKSWATGLDYINQGYPNHPPRTSPLPPTAPWAPPPLHQVAVPDAGGGSDVPLQAVAISVADFKAKLDAVSIECVIPSQYANVIIVQGDANSIVVRLPPVDILQRSEDDLINGPNQYRIRDFYVALFGHPPTALPTTKDKIMLLHANRIGEYTMANCD